MHPEVVTQLLIPLAAGNDGNFLCTLMGIVEDVQLPLTIVSIVFIGLTKIGSAFFPRAAQQAGEWMRGLVMGVLLVCGATWIAQLLFGTTDEIGCS